MNPLPTINTNSPGADMQGYQGAMTAYNQGVENYPQNQANYVNSGISQNNLSGAAGSQMIDYNTFASMLQNDPYGQQYMNQNFNTSGSVGSSGGSPVGSGTITPLSQSLQAIVGAAPNLQTPTVTSTIPQLTQQNIGQGFQGFTDPMLGAEARNQNLSDVAGTMNAIQSLIGNDWNAIQSGATQEGQKQQQALQGLLGVASMYMNMYNAQASAAGAGGSASAGQLTQQVAQSLDTDARKGMTLQDLMMKYKGNGPGQADANSIYQAYTKYNRYDSVTKKNVGYGDPKQSADDLAGMGITMKDFTPAKTPAQTKQAAADQTKIGALKGMGDMINAYYNGATDIGGVHIYNPLNKDYGSQKGIYMRQLAAALKASKSIQTINAFEEHLPGTIGVNPDTAFKGHLTQVMDANQLKLVRDKSGNVSIVDYGSYDPSKDSQVPIENLSMDQIRQLLSNL